LLAVLSSLAWLPAAARADWPQLRGNPQRTGFTPELLKPPFRLAWAAEFADERLGTAMEPIAADGRVFVATHAGNLYALDARTGEARWRFTAPGPFLHSPACDAGRVVAGCAGGGVYAVDASSGKLVWAHVPEGTVGGFAAAPLIAGGQVFIGSRDGGFWSLDLASGAVLGHAQCGAPVRQPAALAGGRVICAAEDLVVRAFATDAVRTGAEVWQTPVSGQSVRDYPPVVVAGAAGRSRVVVRTNPLRSMAQRIARDSSLLARQAGADDSDWRKLDAWIKSDAARGTPELWAAEQTAIQAYLREQPDARTFFAFDAETGGALPPAPVLWAAGCQGVGTPPALTADGRLLVFHRSAYGNWNHGVAPLVALGLLDLAQNRIEPLFHDRGAQPPWNTFWGTADESQNFTMAGRLVFIAHQGTLSGFDLETRHLFAIHGERDTFGGFRNPPWARNEWHGPARGGVAVADGRVFWLTGSRLLCLVSGESGAAGPLRSISAAAMPGEAAPALPPPDLRRELRAVVTEVLSRRWAPLFVEPGLAGREFFFAHSGETFAALAWAYPHLAGDPLQARVREWLAAEWERHPPFSAQGAYAVDAGARREFFPVAGADLTRAGQYKPPHPFGHLAAVWRYATRVGETNRVLTAWPHLRASFADWRQTGWQLDGARGDLYANRYLGALLALERLAELAGNAETARSARDLAGTTSRELAAWWRRAAQQPAAGSFKGVGELDPFIGGGDALSFKVTPHRHKIALLRDLTPEVAARARAEAADAVEAVWRRFARLHATWWLVGEERQVHFGENFVDPPDLALGAFQALAWLRGAGADELARRVDMPFGRADFSRLMKLGIALDAAAAGRRPGGPAVD
jgi:hypothetical protein